MTYEERREAVSKIITERGGLKSVTPASAKRAANAYELAAQDPPLPEPWPQLAAYRYARELLKSADLSTEELKKAQKLMQLASKANSLGPLPTIYRSAILNRLSASLHSNTEEQIKHNQLAQQAFRDAIRKTQAWYSRLYEQKGGDLNLEEYDNLASSYFNMLELMAILCNSEKELYKVIPESNPFAWQNVYGEDMLDDDSPSKWLVIGHDAGLMSVFIPREIAFQELNSRAQSKPAALFFRLSDNKNPVRATICEYRLGSDNRWQRGSYGQLLFLAYALAGALLDFETMRNELYRRREEKQAAPGEAKDATGNYFRQQKKRLKGLFKELNLTAGIDEDDIFLDNPLRLNPAIEVFGVIDSGILPKL